MLHAACGMLHAACGHCRYSPLNSDSTNRQQQQQQPQQQQQQSLPQYPRWSVFGYMTMPIILPFSLSCNRVGAVTSTATDTVTVTVTVTSTRTRTRTWMRTPLRHLIAGSVRSSVNFNCAYSCATAREKTILTLPHLTPLPPRRQSSTRRCRRQPQIASSSNCSESTVLAAPTLAGFKCQLNTHTHTRVCLAMHRIAQPKPLSQGLSII